jgi:hypothetical protein
MSCASLSSPRPISPSSPPPTTSSLFKDVGAKDPFPPPAVAARSRGERGGSRPARCSKRRGGRAPVFVLCRLACRAQGPGRPARRVLIVSTRGAVPSSNGAGTISPFGGLTLGLLGGSIFARGFNSPHRGGVGLRVLVEHAELAPPAVSSHKQRRQRRASPKISPPRQLGHQLPAASRSHPPSAGT